MNTRLLPHPSALVTAALVAGLLAGCSAPTAAAGMDRGTWARFEARLEYLRQLVIQESSAETFPLTCNAKSWTHWA
jgi:hypothetical protein